MTIVEKFNSFDEFTIHYNSLLGNLLPMNEHLYFMCHYSNWCPTTLDLVRSYYDDPTDELKTAIKNDVRNNYFRMLQASNPEILPISSTVIDVSLRDIMQGAEPSDLAYPMYLFPWPRAKFLQRFYSNVLPSVVQDVFSALIESGHLQFKKTYTIVLDLPFVEEVKNAITLAGPSSTPVDVAKIFTDMQETVTFYQAQYNRIIQEKKELEKVIDSLSQQIVTQTLTRWY